MGYQLNNKLSASSVTRYSLYAMLIFSPLARASVQGWAITSIHLVTLIALTAFLVEKSLTWNWKWIKTSLDKPILILVTLSILSTVFSVHKYTSIWSTVLLLNYLTIYYLVIHTVRTRSQVRQLIYLILGVATFMAVFGLFKWSGANPFPWWDYSDLNHKPGYFSSTFGNCNNFAGYMEMAIPLLLGLLLTGLSGWKRLSMICILSVLFTGLILSLSKGGWLGIFMGLCLMALALVTSHHFKNKRLIAALSGGCVVLIFIILSSSSVVETIRTFEQRENMPSFSKRVEAWGAIVEMIQDYPLSGTGPGTFATVFTQYHPPRNRRYFMAHNDYLHFTSEVGIPLGGVIFWMVFTSFRRGLKKLKNPSRLVRGTTLGALSGITAILVHSIFDFNLHIPANAILFTVLAAIAVAPVPIDNTSAVN